MWAIKNQTSYAADRIWARDKAGAHLWIVSVKATFTLGLNGKLTLTDEQPPPLLAPEFHGDPQKTSLQFEAEVGPPKPTTDILVTGSAHTPGGRPAPNVLVTLKVSDIQKSLVVYGARVYHEGMTGLGISKPLPFTSCPLRYENAFGGADLADPDPRRQKFDSRNPVGKGIAADRRRLIGQPAHSIEYLDGDPAKKGPAGFGPIASFWSPRRELAGTYDDNWRDHKKPLLPDDYHEAFAQCAPIDQRPTRALTGGEQVALVNMSPDGLLQFTLPKIFLTFSTWFGKKREEHRGRLAMVLIEPEVRTVKLIWLTSLVVRPTQSEYLDHTIVKEKPYVR